MHHQVCGFNSFTDKRAITTAFYACSAAHQAFCCCLAKNWRLVRLDGFVDSSTEVSFATFRYLGATAGGLFVERARALERFCYARSVRARSSGAFVLRYGWHSHRAKAPSVNSAFSTIHTASARQEQVKSHSSTVACTQHLRRAHCKEQNWHWGDYCRSCRMDEVGWCYYPE